MGNAAKLIIGAVLALAISGPGTAGPKSPKLAKCDGKARRPANPYGSILPSVDPAAGTMTPPAAGPGGIDVFPADPPRRKPGGPAAPPPSGGATPTLVPPIGAIDSPQRYRSC